VFLRSHYYKYERCVRFNISTLATKNAACRMECNNNSKSLGSLWESLHPTKRRIIATWLHDFTSQKPWFSCRLCFWYI